MALPAIPTPFLITIKHAIMSYLKTAIESGEQHY